MTKTERTMIASVVREIRAIKRSLGRPDNQKVRHFIRTTLTK